MSGGLTKLQLACLEFIRSHIDREGVSPSFDEMKDALDLKSKSGIHRLITALEERSFIRRLHNRARAIEIIDRTHAVLTAETFDRARKASAKRGLSVDRYVEDAVLMVLELDEDEISNQAA